MFLTVVTSGQTRIDIDAYACIIAYTELLQLEGQRAEAVIPGKLNASVPGYLADLGSYRQIPSTPVFKTVLVDISDPAFTATFATPDTITEVFDHHLGFEDFWKQRLGDQAHIEFIGACATLIWEEFVQRGATERISVSSATLLAAAIISNSLNFHASMTSVRDREAFIAITKQAQLPQSFTADYFRACEQDALKNVTSTIVNDTKIQSFPNLGIDLVIGQCELWDSSMFVREQLATIENVLKPLGQHWIFTSPSISEGKNYLYTKNADLKKWFTEAIGVVWNDDIGTTDRLYLRKEILPALQKLLP